MTTYTRTYHAAINHLIEHGAYGGDTSKGRALCAKALWQLRAQYGTRRARSECFHMHFIAGMLPVKRDGN